MEAQQRSDRKTPGRVAVIGGGSIGSMTAWRLAERGAQVTVFEQFSPGHDRSAAGGETRIFRTAYFEGAQYVPVLQRAEQLWRDLEQETGRQLLSAVGALMIGPPDSPAMMSAAAGIEDFNLDCERLGAEQIRQRHPQHVVNDDEVAVLDRSGGYLRPELAVLTAAVRSEQLGATIHRYDRVNAIDPNGDGVTVRTESDTLRFDYVVVSSGPWTPRLLPWLADVIDVQRRLQAWFVPRSPALWQGAACPVFMRTGQVHYYGMPSLDGITVKLGVTGSLDDPVQDPDCLDRTVTVEELAAHRAVIREYLPDLDPDPVRLAAYQDGYTPDKHALVGEVPGMSNVFVAAGFSGHGFKMAPAIGEVLTDLILEGGTELPISHLDPRRFHSSAGA